MLFTFTFFFVSVFLFNLITGCDAAPFPFDHSTKSSSQDPEVVHSHDAPNLRIVIAACTVVGSFAVILAIILWRFDCGAKREKRSEKAHPNSSPAVDRSSIAEVPPPQPESPGVEVANSDVPVTRGVNLDLEAHPSARGIVSSQPPDPQQS
ncbi:hypothetical protein BDN72DRAFT_838766 [Pluteus cervinus]|uniref:Uncharacterized protein n=1 Tax=Pluteus cervinus TaxID=181527 RepID=A0ACD3AY58_9AGAR|nr:hypothetical protein BDN72DRAFT_838766 [Pluteus cervinus]